MCCVWQAQAATSGSGASAALNLTLGDAVRLALRNNRRLIDARLERVVNRFTLRVAENRFRPRVSVGPYTKWSRAEASDGEVGVASTVTMRVPTGGEFEVRLDSGARTGDVPPGERYSHELTFTFKQPLLHGAGARIETAPLQIARVEEEIAVLALKQAVIDVVSSVVRSYRDVMQAERRVDIRARSLARPGSF